MSTVDEARGAEPGQISATIDAGEHQPRFSRTTAGAALAVLRSSDVRRLLPLAILLVIVAGFSAASPAYLTFQNLTNILDQSSVLVIAAMGLTLIIIAGSIDLSVGSVAGLAAVMMASFAAGGANGAAALGGATVFHDIGLAAILVGLVAGLVVGFANGAIFTWLAIPSFIVTLGTLTLVRGLILVFTHGRPISIENTTLNNLGAGSMFGIPDTFLVAAGATLFCIILAHWTAIGRYIYALGGSEKVARMSGLPTARTKIIMFALAGGFAALAGMLDATRTTAGVPTQGTGLELTAIAAVVIGGTPLTGGTGGPSGTLLGALIITALNAGLNIIGVPPEWNGVITGGVLIAAVVASLDRRRIGIIK